MYYKDLHIAQIGYNDRYLVFGIPRYRFSAVKVAEYSGADAKRSAEEYIDFLVERGCGEKRQR